jgi:hypothetical protein
MTRGSRPGWPDSQWILALLPLFPVLLLGARLWYLSRQELQTTLLLIQEINPLGLLTALVLSLIWLFPVVILLIRALGALLSVSLPDEPQPERYWLHRISGRIPDWVLAGAVLMALLTWQMRFLPTLLMLCVVTVALIVRDRRPERTQLRRIFVVVLPLVAGLAGYALWAQAIRDSFQAREFVTALLLATPLAMAPLLTGPLPRWAARVVTPWLVALFVLTPTLAGAAFINTPVLPFAALKIDTAVPGEDRFTVRHGYIITTDDRMTTLLDRRGKVHFLLNDQLVAKTLCPIYEEAPVSAVTVHGWHVEQTLLEWRSRANLLDSADPRYPLCEGRIR